MDTQFLVSVIIGASFICSIAYTVNPEWTEFDTVKTYFILPFTCVLFIYVFVRILFYFGWSNLKCFALDILDQDHRMKDTSLHILTYAGTLWSETKLNHFIEIIFSLVVWLIWIS